MIGYQKTTALGTADCVITEPRACYRRAWNLSPTWKRVRLGVFFSLIGTGGPNEDCINESILYTDLRDQISFGLASGDGAPGMAGHRFVGMGCPKSGTRSAPYWDASNSAWKLIGNSVYINTCIADGTTLSVGGSNAYLYTAHRAPSGTELFAAFLGLDITLSSTGATVQVASNPSGGPFGYTDVSRPALLNLMMGSSYLSAGTLTGGWWSSDGISGLSDVYLRMPHRLGRLRVFAMRVEELG
ncbi:MAG TPA: hypothetical protein VK163_08615 [Opitutaceae bacterium]|nr:hypothetical protein [Opitutaceae bacterium]